MPSYIQTKLNTLQKRPNDPKAGRRGVIATSAERAETIDRTERADRTERPHRQPRIFFFKNKSISPDFEYGICFRKNGRRMVFDCKRYWGVGFGGTSDSLLLTMRPRLLLERMGMYCSFRALHLWPPTGRMRTLHVSQVHWRQGFRAYDMHRDLHSLRSRHYGVD